MLCASAGATVVTVDDTDAEAVFSGDWVTSNATAGFWGTGYLHNNQVQGPTGTYTPNLPTSGTWAVWARWTAGSNRDAAVPYTIHYDGGVDTVYVNQQSDGGAWQKLGDYAFAAGTGGYVTLDTAGTSMYVIADAVAFSANVGADAFIDPASLTAYASSNIDSSRVPNHAVDGSGMDVLASNHVGSTNGNGVNWLSALNDTTGWFKVDLGATHQLQSMDIWNFSSTTSAGNNRGVQTFDLYVSNVDAPSSNDFANSAEWTLVQADVTLGKAPAGVNDMPDLVNFAANGTDARWVAFDITSNYGDAYTGLGEIRFFEVPEPSGLALLALSSLFGFARRRRS
jgi:hypothetical protein